MTRLALLLYLLPAVASAGVRIDVFTSDACKPCMQMAPIVERLRREGYPITVHDYDARRSTADWLGVTAIPAFVVVRDGRPEAIMQGLVPESSLREFFAGTACDPADVAPVLPLPLSLEPVDIEDLPEEAPPAPQPASPPSDHGPYEPDAKREQETDVVIIYEAPASNIAQDNNLTVGSNGQVAEPKSSKLEVAGKVAKTAAAFTMPLWAPYVGGPIAGGLLVSLIFGALGRRRKRHEYRTSATRLEPLPRSDAELRPVQPPSVDCSTCSTVADLRSQLARRPVTYKNPPQDDGLRRMRQAIRDVGEEYPAFRSWQRIVEKTYDLILSGETTNVG